MKTRFLSSYTLDTKKYFHGKKVLVMGLGLHGGGIGLVKFLARNGARIKVTDLRPRNELLESLGKLRGVPVEYVLGEHRKQDFCEANLIIKNPAVPRSSPYLKIARLYNIPVDTDIGIFFELYQGLIIGVTGTKGKSTTASLIFEFLRHKFKYTALAGNIGISVLEVLSKAKKKSPVILELSNWQLEDLTPHKKSPQIAVVTGIMPDHLNRYRTFGEYIKSKKLIYKFQGKNDILFLNFDDIRTRSFCRDASSRVIFFSRQHNLSETLKNKNSVGAFILDNYIVFGENEKKIIRTKHIKLKGEHNLINILAAVSLASYLGISIRYMRTALKLFSGIHSRIENIRSLGGVTFYNDTAATMPEATIAAIRVLRSVGAPTIILIGGGEDKNLNYKELAREIRSYVKYFILFPGTASQKIKKALQNIAPEFYGSSVVSATTMREAVRDAYKKSVAGDIVLLSPGAASFNMFKNEFDRGEQFVEAVKALEKK